MTHVVPQNEVKENPKMKINCTGCGHTIEIDDAYSDFEGPVRCWVCRAVFEIRIEDGSVKAVRSRESTPTPLQQRVFAGDESA